MKTRTAGSLVPVLMLLVLVPLPTTAVSDVDSAVPTVADTDPAATIAADDNITCTTAAAAVSAEGRGHMKDMQKIMLNPYMLIPQLIMLGFAPIVLANLKMMVMSSLMINNMALNAAVFMIIRNMVFGPKPKVKYVNYGYKNPAAHRHTGDSQHAGGADDPYGAGDPYGQQANSGQYSQQATVAHYNIHDAHHGGHYDHRRKSGDGNDNKSFLDGGQDEQKLRPSSPEPLPVSWDDTQSSIRRKRDAVVS